MKQYSFQKVDLIIDNEEVTGFSDSAGIITAARSAMQHGKVMDARGNMNVTTSADLSGTISFNLLHTSDWIAKMQNKAIISQSIGIANNNSQFLSINASIQDKMGGTKVSGKTGYIPKVANATRGNGIAVIPWTIMFEQLHFNEAGNFASIFDSVAG